MVSASGNLVSSLEEIVARGDFVVPPYPAAAMRLRRLVDSSNFRLSEVADAASADPALAAALLRIVNSALYRGAGPAITTLARAVHRLGARSVASIALAASLSASACAEGPLSDVKYRVWRRSVTCALACQELAAQRGLDPAEAFLAGLLHGFGRSVAVGCLERLLPNPPTAQHTLLEWLQAVEPHRHLLARKVAEHWQLPAEILQSVTSAPGAGMPTAMSSLVSLADQLAAALDQGATLEQLVSTQGVTHGEQRLVTTFAAGLGQALEALVGTSDTSKRRSTNAVGKPSSALNGEVYSASVPLADLKNRKAPVALEVVAIAQEGVVFLNQRPMQESSVARLAVGAAPKTVEGWFSIALCVPDRSRFRIEAQAFAASRELRDLLLELWTAAKRR